METFELFSQQILNDEALQNFWGHLSSGIADMWDNDKKTAAEIRKQKSLVLIEEEEKSTKIQEFIWFNHGVVGLSSEQLINRSPVGFFKF